MAVDPFEKKIYSHIGWKALQENQTFNPRANEGKTCPFLFISTDNCEIDVMGHLFRIFPFCFFQFTGFRLTISLDLKHICEIYAFIYKL